MRLHFNMSAAQKVLHKLHVNMQKNCYHSVGDMSLKMWLQAASTDKGQDVTAEPGHGSVSTQLTTLSNHRDGTEPFSDCAVTPPGGSLFMMEPGPKQCCRRHMCRSPCAAQESCGAGSCPFMTLGTTLHVLT